VKVKKNLVPLFDVFDHKLFDTKLNSEIKRWASADSLVTHSAIELYADQIASSIATCAKSAKIPSVKKVPQLKICLGGPRSSALSVLELAWHTKLGPE
jgi:hypothetical protein